MAPESVMARRGPIVGNKQDELGRFVDGLREYLGLDPIPRPHAEARVVRKRVTDVIRFGATIPDPWHRSQTPIRNSGN